MAIKGATRSLRRSVSASGQFRSAFNTNPPIGVLARAFGKLSVDFTDFRPAFKAVAPLVSKGLLGNIKRKESFVGQWAPTNKLYQRRKVSKGFSPLDIVRTGAATKHLGTRKSRLKLGKQVLEVGFRGIKWKHMPAVNFGSTDKTTGVVHTASRGFMGWSPAMERDVADATGKLAQQKLAKVAREISKNVR